MKSNSGLKIILITVGCILIAALSFFFLAGILSSPETYSGIIRSIDDKVETVLKLTASSTAASAGITAIPGDAGTPIAEKLAEFSEYGILILCVLYAEKYLLSILGSGVFKFIIPIACILYPLGFFRNLEGIKPLLKKIAIVSLALYFVIPLSVRISDRIYETYQASIDNTISAAEEIALETKQLGQSEESQSVLRQAWSALSGGASDLVDRGAEILNRFIESLAIMIVTSCVAPILVLLFSLWIIKQILGTYAYINNPELKILPNSRKHLDCPDPSCEEE